MHGVFSSNDPHYCMLVSAVTSLSFFLVSCLFSSSILAKCYLTFSNRAAFLLFLWLLFLLISSTNSLLSFSRFLEVSFRDSEFRCITGNSSLFVSATVKAETSGLVVFRQLFFLFSLSFWDFSFDFSQQNRE